MYVHQNPTEIPIICTYIGGSAFHWLKVRMYVHQNPTEIPIICTYIGGSAFHRLKVRMYVHRNRAEMLLFCTYIGWGVAKVHTSTAMAQVQRQAAQVQP